jgi:hypothetical protein
MFRALMFALVVFSFVSSAHATPAQVLLIRHAEKPDGDEGIHLSERGRERAAALAGFFSKDPRVTTRGIASEVFGAAPNDAGNSVRSIETVEPFAQSRHLIVHTEFKTNNFRALANALLSDKRYDGKVILVCWVRDEIPAFANALGVNGKLKWKPTTFDRVWRIDFKDGKVTGMIDLPQKLLVGDSSF